MKHLYESKKPTHLPDFPSGLVWFNSEEKNFDDNRNITLIDFWSYSCINSVRSIPFLKALYEKYNKFGLEIIGVHTPEFNFEKNIYNIKKEVERFEIPYPVVVDNNHRLWSIFNNVYLPSYYLYSAHQQLRFTHFGEDYYSRIEENIVKLLKESHYLTDSFDSGTTIFNPIERTTAPEIYAGHNRISGLSCYERLNPNTSSKYTPLRHIETNKLGVEGVWTFYSDRVSLNSFQGKIVLPYKAESLNIITGAKMPVCAEIKLNGKSLSDCNRGSDINDEGHLIIKDYRLYNLVESDKLQHNTLEILFNSDDVDVFAFSFG
ncbi:MAG: thioredoxin-like domain-containing protein [bacterium]